MATKKIKKEYHTLDEAALMLYCKPDDLIHLGAHNKIPIYVLAANWHSITWEKEIKESDNCYGETDISYGEPRLYPLSKPFVLSGLVQLRDETLARYEANPEALINPLSIADNPYDDESTVAYEYRFFNPNDQSKSIDIKFKECKLVILSQDMILIKKHFQKDSKESLGEKEKKTLLKLVIGMAIKGYCYDPTKKKNVATNDICKDLEKLGISLDKDTILKWLKIAEKLIPSQTPKKD